MPVLLDPPIPESFPTELQSGDRLSQREFHEIYSRMPGHIRAELIGGIVHMASPMKRRHGTNTAPLASLFLGYENATPGTESGENLTVVLNDANEPQPDVCLRVLPGYGGQSINTVDDYIGGAPELVGEVALSSRTADLSAKKKEYAAAGVREYLVLDLRDRQLHWFDLKSDHEQFADSDGIIRIGTFPGLWIDAAAVISRNQRGILATLDLGLASPEHADFVRLLADRKRAIDETKAAT